MQEGPRVVFEQLNSDQCVSKNIRARVGQKEADEVEQPPVHVGPYKFCVYQRWSSTLKVRHPMTVSLNRKKILFSNAEEA